VIRILGALSVSTAIVLTVSFLTSTLLAQTAATVTIDGGVVEGIFARDVFSFKGIPYAAPPIRDNRWRAPQPITAWSGIRQAKAFAHDCMQKPVPWDDAPLRTVPSEDCLALNIWRPAAFAADNKLPVLVWIYGGGFVNGGSSPAEYDGTSFAQRGIIFVSLNYRLGRFGFFAHPALINAKEGPTGNFALMDQIAALRWVQRNIAAFGGDPHNVTLMGHSAGGLSVLALLTSPETKGLFQRAVVLSGGGRSFVLGGYRLTGGTPADPSADQVGENFAESVGIHGNGAQTIAQLRALPAEVIVGDLNMSGEGAGTATVPTFVGGPIVDNYIVVDTPQAMLQAGNAARVPIIIGTTYHELAVLAPPSAEDPLSYFGAAAGNAREAYDPAHTLDARQIRSAVGADMTMQEPARFVAKQITRIGGSAWVYRFGYVAESMRAKRTVASHASEVPFLFGTLDAHYGGAVAGRDRIVSRDLNLYFANFAKSGQPNDEGLAFWPKYDLARSEIMDFTPDQGIVARLDPWKKRLDLLERVESETGPQ
jgi:para-nitrobenzyl esterase